ncbi:hypothetical protein TNCV_105171 [Trichonephila clavipes]|nr:hypothetical protein TNCV_105171 [Trichonephila clavipes]
MRKLFSRFLIHELHLNVVTCIAARVGRDPVTVSRIWNRWIQDGNTGRTAVLDLSRPLSLAAENTNMLLACSYITSPESRIGVVCKTTNVYTNSPMTFAAAGILSSETMAAATLDAV